MSALPQHQPLTEAEYLALERDSAIKHEFVNGKIYAMSGSSEAHNLITGNIFAALHAQRKKPCRIYMTDMRVQVAASHAYFYPDVSAACGEIRFVEDETIATLLNPTLIVEVLSPSTESHDKITKLAHYTSIPSLQDYLLVSQDAVQIERYHRQAAGWLYTTVKDISAAIKLDAIGSTIPLKQVYDDVDLTSA